MGILFFTVIHIGKSKTIEELKLEEQKNQQND
jgi:hypothetical protein